MNFDSKYLIRWGIPGAVFMVFIAGMYLSFNMPKFQFKQVDIAAIVSSIVIMTFLSVTIGYLLHQIYFSINWSGKNTKQNRIIDEAMSLIRNADSIKTYNNHQWGDNYHKDYYVFEFFWHKFLLDTETEERNYISERYSHMLSTVHGLGALKIAFLTALLINLLTFFVYFDGDAKISMYVVPVIILIINIAFYIVIAKGFKYYSANLNHYQGSFLNEYLNNTM